LGDLHDFYKDLDFGTEEHSLEDFLDFQPIFLLVGTELEICR